MGSQPSWIIIHETQNNVPLYHLDRKEFLSKVRKFDVTDEVFGKIMSHFEANVICTEYDRYKLPRSRKKASNWDEGHYSPLELKFWSKLAEVEVRYPYQFWCECYKHQGWITDSKHPVYSEVQSKSTACWHTTTSKHVCTLFGAVKNCSHFEVLNTISKN